MDPQSCIQDVHRCDICESAILHSYCDFCNVNLCKPCVGEHISDGYDKHKIVLFQERRSTLIYPKCENHSHKFCKFQCQDCGDIFICSSCMASKKHKGHNFEEVAEVYKAKKEVIEKDAEELVNLISPSYVEVARDLQKQIAKLDGEYKKLATIISKNRRHWHREIDLVINKMKTEISEMKIKHRDILQKHLDEVKQKQYLINQTLTNIKEIVISTVVSPIIEYSSKIREFRKLPPKVQVSLPTFIPKPIDREKLYSVFGHITPLSTDIEEIVWPLNQPKFSSKQLMDEPEHIATIKIRYENKHVGNVTFPEEHLWTSGQTNDKKCFNIESFVLQTIKKKIGKYPNDIAVDIDGYLLYSSGKTVNKIKKGRTEELIRLQGWKPFKLCVTSIGDLLVTMFNDNGAHSKIVRYSGFTEKQTIQFDEEGKTLYSRNHEMFITENKNSDICVADCGSGAVVVVNQDGKLKWRYTGHSSVSKNKPFTPYGITTDSQSHILTADHNNHCIHILDQNGQFLRYIDNCDLENQRGLCVDNDDNLFVCEYSKGNVKKFKYLK